MLRDAADIAALIISLAWVCVGTKSFINPTFRVALPSLNVLEDIFGLLGPSFAPGLFELLNAAAPATISWFRSLPPVPVSRQIWGVYAFVMEKQGYRPRLYVGSRTAETAGVRSRMLQHLDGIFAVPLKVARAKAEGFAITNIGLLAWCPTPAPCDVNARDASELDRHLGTPRHAQTVARGGKALPWKCVPCGKQWPYKSDYNAHCKLKMHQAKVAQLAALLPPSVVADFPDPTPPSWYGCHPWLHHTTSQRHDWPHKRVMTTRTFRAFDLRSSPSIEISLH